MALPTRSSPGPIPGWAGPVRPGSPSTDLRLSVFPAGPCRTRSAGFCGATVESRDEPLVPRHLRNMEVRTWTRTWAVPLAEPASSCWGLSVLLVVVVAVAVTHRHRTSTTSAGPDDRHLEHGQLGPATKVRASSTAPPNPRCARRRGPRPRGGASRSPPRSPRSVLRRRRPPLPAARPSRLPAVATGPATAQYVGLVRRLTRRSGDGQW